MKILLDLNVGKSDAPKAKRNTARPNSKAKPIIPIAAAQTADTIVSREPVFAYPPSTYQMGVYNFLLNQTGSCIVNAKAGSGKTSTMEMIARNLNQTVNGSRQFVTMLAFNKKIADELGKRMPSWIKCGTFHSIGYSTWIRHTKQKITVKNNKVYSLLRNIIPENEFSSFGGVASTLVSLAKNSGIGTWLRDDIDSAWLSLISHHCLDIGEDPKSVSSAISRKERLITYCRQALKESSLMRSLIDYDDMLYLPVLENAYFFRNDVLFVDEAQDTNPIQLACIKRMLKSEGRLIAVGDPNQAIYGFRGADSDAIDKLTKWFKCTTLPLSISYRCDKNIVKKAQSIVPDIECFDSNEDGIVQELVSYNKNTFNVGDAIVCRNTAPLIRFAYTLIKNRIAANVIGRDIGNGLIKLITDFESDTIPQLANDLNMWVDKQTERLSADEGSESAIAAINDKAECIKIFMDNLDPNNFTVEALLGEISALFSDSAGAVVQLLTVHRSKGNEWDTVFILDPNLMPSKYARLNWQKKQEANLEYVAITRAKHNLYYITSGKWEE